MEEVSERFGAIGGLLNGYPVICGGYSSFNDEYHRNGVTIGRHIVSIHAMATALPFADGKCKTAIDGKYISSKS